MNDYQRSKEPVCLDETIMTNNTDQRMVLFYYSHTRETSVTELILGEFSNSGVNTVARKIVKAPAKISKVNQGTDLFKQSVLQIEPIYGEWRVADG